MGKFHGANRSVLKNSKRMNSSSAYVPKKGDIVWIDFDPVEGHEQ